MLLPIGSLVCTRSHAVPATYPTTVKQAGNFRHASWSTKLQSDGVIITTPASNTGSMTITISVGTEQK